jgi:hypothetical protein
MSGAQILVGRVGWIIAKLTSGTYAETKSYSHRSAWHCIYCIYLWSFNPRSSRICHRDMISPLPSPTGMADPLFPEIARSPLFTSFLNFRKYTGLTTQKLTRWVENPFIDNERSESLQMRSETLRQSKLDPGGSEPASAFPFQDQTVKSLLKFFSRPIISNYNRSQFTFAFDWHLSCNPSFSVFSWNVIPAHDPFHLALSFDHYNNNVMEIGARKIRFEK